MPMSAKAAWLAPFQYPLEHQKSQSVKNAQQGHILHLLERQIQLPAYIAQEVRIPLSPAPHYAKIAVQATTLSVELQSVSSVLQASPRQMHPWFASVSHHVHWDPTALHPTATHVLPTPTHPSTIRRPSSTAAAWLDSSAPTPSEST